MSDVAFRSVTKRFGETTVLDGLTLEIEAGEFMVLVGPSGCGKSTALRLIAGLEEPTEGELVVGGRVVNGVAPKDRDVAMVFQTYALYPHMSVRENLAFGLRLRHVPRAERERLVAEAATVLGLELLLERRPRELSGGQRQRVALGRAITRKPRAFLFDEPLSNLDARLRVQMRAEIAALQRRLGTTTVYVTHDQVEAMTMGHRIAVLHGGRLQQVGPPLDVYERPANAFVASFIGSPPMNLLRATPAAGGEMLEGDGFVLPAPGRLSALGQGSRPVLVGIRPEALTRATAAAPAPASATRWSAMVDSSELLGSEAYVHARIGEQRLVARLDPHLVPSTGERIELVAEPSALHLFDAETGVRLAG